MGRQLIARDVSPWAPTTNSSALKRRQCFRPSRATTYLKSLSWGLRPRLLTAALPGLTLEKAHLQNLRFGSVCRGIPHRHIVFHALGVKGCGPTNRRYPGGLLNCPNALHRII